MKKYLFLLLALIVVPLYAQMQGGLQYTDINHNSAARFKLYPTTNMYNFLKLDTRLGVVNAVQFDINGPNEYEYHVGSVWKSIPVDQQVDGRYELYPTQNYYTFLLLDQIDGKVYHVQWSMERINRGLYEISSKKKD